MTAEQLLEDLRQGGARVGVAGDKLRVDAPVGFLSPGFLSQLRARRAELIDLLRARPFGDARIEDLPADWRVEWEERAAIREYDGGQAREHAEAEALREVVARMKAAGINLDSLGYPY